MSRDTSISFQVCGSIRQQEHERVLKFIENIENNLAGAPFFLNLFAPKGFGKTAFVEQVFGSYRQVLLVSLIRMGSFHTKDDKDIALRELLVLIIHDLAGSLPKRVVPLPSDYASWTSKEQLAKLLLGLVSEAKDLEKVMLLLMDDYDMLPEEQQYWLQRNVFSPAIRTRKIAIILTSETELRFTESFELRMRLECNELTSLDPEAISHAWPEYEGIAREIHGISGGLPLLTEEFIEQLEASRVITAVDFQSRAQELKRNYYHSCVEDKVLVDLAPDIRETMPAIALLRRFDVKVLSEVLSGLLPELYKEYRTSDYLDLIDRLRPWVQWRRQGGYALNPAFRILLQGYVLTIKPNLYMAVNRAMEALYRAWLEREYREHYLVELIYHTLALHRTENASALFPVQDKMSQMRIGDELLKYLTGDGGRRLQETDLDSLHNSLNQDSDLKDCISEDAKRVIQGLIEQRTLETREERGG